MIFKYIARDPMGRKVEGEIDVANAERLQTELNGRALKLVWYQIIGTEEDLRRKEPPRAALELREEDEVELLDEEARSQVPNQKKKGCSLSLGWILFIIYLIYQILSIFK